jgi:hypothetical protein
MCKEVLVAYSRYYPSICWRDRGNSQKIWVMITIVLAKILSVASEPTYPVYYSTVMAYFWRTQTME